jgi:membrane protease YdiL (CAAX protease family)
MEAVFLFLIPLFLMSFYAELRILRYAFLSVGLGYMYVFARVYRLKPADFGLRRFHLRRSGLVTMVLTGLMSLALLAALYLVPELFSQGVKAMRLLNMPLWLILTSYALLSAPLQEVVFRGIIIRRLQVMTQNKWVIIGISSVLFALVHVMFWNPMLVVVTFLGGMVWGWLFMRYGNLWPIQVSHSVLGSILIWFVLK